MSTQFKNLSNTIQNHLKNLIQIAELTESEETYEKVAEAWLEKEKAFDKEITGQGMQEVEELEFDDSRAAVVMTYSGSLVLLGPDTEGSRTAGYNSIGIRKDVPETTLRNDSKLARGIKITERMEFEEGPVSLTSPVFKIAVCNFELALTEQETLVADVTIALAEKFADVNKTLLIE